MKLVNTCLFLNNNNNDILLGYKKRGFGCGKWYGGCGGKVEPSETILESCIREAEEEYGIIPTEIYNIGIIRFHFENPKYLGTMENHVFISTKWLNEPKESDEMKPKWFNIENEIPFNQMWEDFSIWFIYLKSNKFNKNIRMNFDFYLDKNDKLISFKNNSIIINE